MYVWAFFSLHIYHVYLVQLRSDLGKKTGYVILPLSVDCSGRPVK